MERRTPGTRSTLRSALARALTGVVASRFAKPIAQAALLASGLAVLAMVGRTAVAGSGGAAVAATASALSLLPAPRGDAPVIPHSEAPVAPPIVDGVRSGNAHVAREPATPTDPTGSTALDPSVVPHADPAPARSSGASPDDPVVLNAASEGDLRRLPGIGAKRAEAILVLRARLGRFHAIEDLLKVRGIGRATLKRLRPLLRLDPSLPDAGPPRSATSPSP